MDDKETSEPGLNFYFKQKWKLFVTLFCLFSFITMGIHLEISGSTMLPLSVQLGTNLASLSWIVAARSFGYMITIVLFGVIFQSITKNHSELTLAIGYLFPAAATASTPYLKSLWALCLALSCQGMLQGISDLAVNTLVIKMWSSRSTAPLNCVYFGYAVGALLSAVIVRSFREDSTRKMREGRFQSELIGPYTIASVFCIISSIGFGFIAYKQRKSKKERVRVLQSVAKEEINIESKSKRLFNKAKFWKTCSPTTCGQGYLSYGFILMTLLLSFNFFFGGIEQGFTKFIVSFTEKEKIYKNKNDAVYSMLFYWLPMLLGRISCAFLTALWISPHLMLTISLVSCLLTYLLFDVFIWYIGLTSLSLSSLITVYGFSIASVSPTIIGWIKQFLDVSPIELSLILSSNAIGGSGFGFIAGYVFEHYGSKHLFTVLTIAVLLTFTSFLLAFIIQRVHSKRENKTINEQDKTLETFIKQEEDEIFSSDHRQAPTYVNV